MAKEMELVSSDYKQMVAVAAADLSAGDWVNHVDCYGFPLADVDSGDSYTLVYEGKVRVAKATGTAWTAGDAVYHVTANDNYALAGDVFAGFVSEAAASADATGIIEFDGRAAYLKA